jgi:hypothetical protein
MTKEIMECAKVCDSFQRLSTPSKLCNPCYFIIYLIRLHKPFEVRVLTAPKWKATFDGLAQKFVREREGIKYDLQLHGNAMMVTAQEKLEGIEKHLEDIKNLVVYAFDNLHSPGEQKLEDYVISHGGADAVIDKDEQLLELLSLENEKHHWDLRVKHMHHHHRATSSVDANASRLTETRQQFDASVVKVLEDNAEQFQQKFQAQMKQIVRTQDIVVQESNRIIKTVTGGPHDRLLDPVGPSVSAKIQTYSYLNLGHIRSLEGNGEEFLKRLSVVLT